MLNDIGKAVLLSTMCAMLALPAVAAQRAKGPRFLIDRSAALCVAAHERVYSAIKDPSVIIYLELCPETLVSPEQAARLSTNQSFVTIEEGKHADRKPQIRQIIVINKERLPCFLARVREAVRVRSEAPTVLIDMAAC